jgi:hypothetical protein
LRWLLRAGRSLTAVLLAFSAPACADTLERPGLLVHFAEIDAPRADAVAALVAADGRDVAARLGEPLPARLEVWLAENDAAFDRALARLAGGPPAPAWALAVAIPERDAIVIRAARLEVGTPNDIAVTLRHELAHLALWRAGPGLPRWLDEGLAEWASARRLTAGERNALGALARSGALPSLTQDLARDFPPHAERAQTAYLESLAFVDALARDFGEPSVRRLVAELEAGAPLPRAFERAFDAPLAGYETSFRAELARSYSVWQEIYERGSLFTLAALLVIIAFARTWLRRRRALRAMEEAERPPEPPAPPAE